MRQHVVMQAVYVHLVLIAPRKSTKMKVVEVAVVVVVDDVEERPIQTNTQEGHVLRALLVNIKININRMDLEPVANNAKQENILPR